jgi:3-deoxy-D-manno-octulosonate 8-phosphate phosphatase (KDO 8-P phosphatase)
MYVLEQFRQVSTFIFDVDGVLTDGKVLLLENGLQARQMHVRDGLALQMAHRNGYRVLVVSGGYSEPVVKRMQYLGIPDVFLSIKDKRSFAEKYLTENGISWNEVLFMGDDIPDLPLMRAVGLSTCPSDAAPELLQECSYISPYRGGTGCVRDVIEKVLKLHEKWNWDTEITSR